jgi:chemotaxis signal transduction protein
MSSRDANLILRERAVRLALAEGESEVSATEPYVAFMVSGHCFGVPLKSVLYAGRLRHLTPLPGGAPYLLGITVLAGHLVSVLDIAGFLSLRQQGLGDVTCCLVVQAGERELGLCAEQLIGIEDVPVSRIMSIAASSSTLVLSRAAFLDRFRLLILDLDRLIADPRLSGTGDAHG